MKEYRIDDSLDLLFRKFIYKFSWQIITLLLLYKHLVKSIKKSLFGAGFNRTYMDYQ